MKSSLELLTQYQWNILIYTGYFRKWCILYQHSRRTESFLIDSHRCSTISRNINPNNWGMFHYVFIFHIDGYSVVLTDPWYQPYVRKHPVLNIPILSTCIQIEGKIVWNLLGKTEIFVWNDVTHNDSIWVFLALCLERLTQRRRASRKEIFRADGSHSLLGKNLTTLCLSWRKETVTQPIQNPTDSPNSYKLL